MSPKFTARGKITPKEAVIASLQNENTNISDFSTLNPTSLGLRLINQILGNLGIERDIDMFNLITEISQNGFIELKAHDGSQTALIGTRHVYLFSSELGTPTKIDIGEAILS